MKKEIYSMKKAIALCIVLIMVASIFIGCTPSTPSTENGINPENGNNGSTAGKDAFEFDTESVVRLLLAEERLNTALLKNQGDVFEEGVAVMSALAAKAIAGIDHINEYKTEAATVKLLSNSGELSTIKNLSTSSEHVILDNEHGGGKVTLVGENYLFSDFVEVSNSYDSFSSTANYIAFMAEDAAALIDNIKKNVRIVDKWVLIDGFTEYYLHVGENEEILYERTSYKYKICRRYLNEDGNNVYEFLSYDLESGFTDKLTYIPGLHFETARGVFSDGNFEQSDYLICDNTKGYWETYWVAPYSTHVNVSYMVMKDDICYDSFYDPDLKKINFIKIISADKTSDIFWYQGDETTYNVEFDIHFSGFNNIKGVLVDEIVSYDMGGEIGEIPEPARNANKVLLLTNGKEIRVGDTFLDGKVEVTAIRTSMTYPNFTGDLAINIEAPTVAEKLNSFKAFLKEVGLTSRHDLDGVVSGVQRAFDELREITKYHVWNGLNQSTEENVRRAIEIENEKTIEFMKLYDTVKDAPIVDFSDKVAAELNAHFAEVSVNAYRDTVHSGLTISVASLTLSVSDTLLFIENQAYTVNFALASDAGLVHLEKKTGSGTASFAKGSSFSVTVESVTLEIPALVDGEYKLIAYIATDDGVRSSAYTAFEFDTVDTGSESMIEKTKLTASKVSDGGLVLTYTTMPDVHTELCHEEALNHEELYALIAGIACEHGIPSSTNLEMLTDSGNEIYTAMTGDETEISDGVYRLAYNIENGEKTVNGFIYVTLTITPAQENIDPLDLQGVGE